MKKWILLIIVFSLLINLGATTEFSESDAIHPKVIYLDSNTISGGIVSNKIDSCDKEDLTLLYRLSCAEEIKGPHLRIILTSLIINQENLIKELNDTKKQLEETKKKLKELKEAMDSMNILQSSSSNQTLTGMSISKDNKNIEKEDKGIFGFFRKILGIN